MSCDLAQLVAAKGLEVIAVSNRFALVNGINVIAICYHEKHIKDCIKAMESGVDIPELCVPTHEWNINSRIAAKQVLLGQKPVTVTAKVKLEKEPKPLSYEQIRPMVLDKLQVMDTKSIKSWLKSQGLNISLSTNEGWRSLLAEVEARV